MNKEINIIGNGYMGSQISALYLSQGYKVNIFFHKNQNEKLLNHNIKLLKKKFPNNDLKNFEFFDNLNNIKNFPTIECVSENLELKKKIFNKIFGYFDENIFSNTSSIDITKINKDINILHFLNPIFLGIVEIFKTKKINSNGEDMIKTLKHLNFSIVNMMSQNNIILNKLYFQKFQNSSI